MMPWKCPPLHLPNWNNLWKWKEQMNAKEFAHELEKAASFIRQQQAEITKLKLEWQYMADLTEKLQDFAIWMTGCGYDFCQHEYFIKCRDELLIGLRNERKCGDSYDTVCPPSICDCRGKEQA